VDKNVCSVIVGTGSYIPDQVKPNHSFLNNQFYENNGVICSKSNTEIVEKFRLITNIDERRYVSHTQVCSDIAIKAAEECLNSANIDPETLDYIIVAHNFGDICAELKQSDALPNIAARVKYGLKIKEPKTIAYDILFGCPGWLQGVIQAHYYLQSGDAKRILVIGTDTLSRVADPHDRDCMIYADGAAATLFERQEHSSPMGIITHETHSDTFEEAYLLQMDRSYNPAYPNNQLFLKMDGHKLYKYALNKVPLVVGNCIDKAGLSLSQIQKILMHQANEKMDEEIAKRLFKIHGIDTLPEAILPMIINKLGNSSVATIPTLLDLILKNKLENQTIHSGDNIVFASVGAGMHVNALIYKAV
jgi:3-oxoacyl-[acyl-carrier-protein] synthase-3